MSAPNELSIATEQQLLDPVRDAAGAPFDEAVDEQGDLLKFDFFLKHL